MTSREYSDDASARARDDASADVGADGCDTMARMAAALPDTPTSTSNQEEASRSATARVNVGNPCTVVSYDHPTQTATIRPVQSFCRRDPDDEAGFLPYRPSDIPGVPVAFPGTGSVALTWKLQPGDHGHYCVMDRSTDEYRKGGAATTEPQDRRRHDLTDAVFVPAVVTRATPLPAEAIDDDAVVLWGGEIMLGDSTAVSMVALATLVDQRFAQLAAVFNAWVPVPLDGGLALKTALVALLATPWPATVAATKVKAV